MQDLKIVRERQSFDFETRKATISAYIAARITPQHDYNPVWRSVVLAVYAAREERQCCQKYDDGCSVSASCEATRSRYLTWDIDIDDMTTYHPWRRYQPRPTTPPCVRRLHAKYVCWSPCRCQWTLAVRYVTVRSTLSYVRISLDEFLKIVHVGRKSVDIIEARWIRKKTCSQAGFWFFTF